MKTAVNAFDKSLPSVLIAWGKTHAGVFSQLRWSSRRRGHRRHGRHSPAWFLSLVSRQVGGHHLAEVPPSAPYRLDLL